MTLPFRPAHRSLLLALLPALLGAVAPLAVQADVRTGRIEAPTPSPGRDGPPCSPEAAAGPGAPSPEGKSTQPPEEARLETHRAAVSVPWPDDPTSPETELPSTDDAFIFEVEEPRDLTATASDLGDRCLDTVLEPTVAGDEHLLVTGNYFAALSNDGGETFRTIDPDSFFGWQDDEDFCCDQVTAFDPYRGLLVWLAQSQRADDENLGRSLRLAVAQGTDRDMGRFMEYVITPEIFGWSPDAWFDFSDLVVGSDFLYLTALRDWGAPDQGEGVAIRLPLDALAAYQEMEAIAFAEPDVYLRAVRGAGREMVLAATGTYEDLWIWRWREADPAPSTTPIEVRVEPWTEPNRHGEVWLSRVDGTLMAAWAEGHHLGFAWTAGHTAAYPRPHVRVAILDRKTLDVVAQPHLWSRTDDFAFPAVAVNRAGMAGISLLYDGDDGYPGHAVGVLREPCALDGGWRWELVSVLESHPISDPKPWGDYLAIVPDSQNQEGWLAAGYALDEDGAVRPHLVRFAPRDGPE